MAKFTVISAVMLVALSVMAVSPTGTASAATQSVTVTFDDPTGTYAPGDVTEQGVLVWTDDAFKFGIANWDGLDGDNEINLGNNGKTVKIAKADSSLFTFASFRAGHCNASGAGPLTVRGYDAGGALIVTQSISDPGHYGDPGGQAVFTFGAPGWSDLSRVEIQSFNGGGCANNHVLDDITVEVTVPDGPATLGRTGWEVTRPYSPVHTPFFPQHGHIGFYDFIPGPVPGATDAGWAECGAGNPICPNADTIGMSQFSRLGGSFGCLVSADFTFFQSFVSIPTGTTVSQFSVEMSGADDGARVAIYNSAHPSGFIFPGSYIFLGGAQSTTDLSAAMVAGEVNRVVITQVDDCAVGNNLNHAQIVLNGSVIPPEPTDTTPPVIDVDVAGTLGDNDWYVSDVTVTWTVTDAESDVTSTGCDATTVTTDTAGVTFTCEATSAGGTASESVTLKRDATAPEATASRTPAANANGWNNTDVTVSFSGTDNLSGIASCDADVVLGEGTGQSASGTCTDNAGNVSAPATVTDINVDKTAPVVSVTGVTDGATFIVGAEPTVGCDTSDALSGVATAATLTVSGGPLGPITVECGGGEDLAGNTAAAVSATYSVLYDFCGFEQPLLEPVKNFKIGSTVPVKFCLQDASGASVGTAVADVYANGVLQGTARYDGDDEHYVFNLRTKGMAEGPLTIEVRLDDGSTHSIEVELGKKGGRGR